MRALHFIVILVESTFLCALLGWMVFTNAIPVHPEFITGETELRFKIKDGQEELLRRLDSFTVFYATKDNPRQWTDPKLRFSQKIDESVVNKWYTHKLAAGITQFRLEFNPKKGVAVGRQWPKISTLYLGERSIRADEVCEFFYGPGQKASYDVILSEYTKGGVLWIVVVLAAALDVLIMLVVAHVMRKDRTAEVYD